MVCKLLAFCRTLSEENCCRILVFSFNELRRDSVAFHFRKNWVF
jgi:hypothetical protein